MFTSLRECFQWPVKLFSQERMQGIKGAPVLDRCRRRALQPHAVMPAPFPAPTLLLLAAHHGLSYYNRMREASRGASVPRALLGECVRPHVLGGGAAGRVRAACHQLVLDTVAVCRSVFRSAVFGCPWPAGQPAVAAGWRRMQFKHPVRGELECNGPQCCRAHHEQS